MKKIFLVLLIFYSGALFSLETVRVKNAELPDLYLYNGSRLDVMPYDGVIVYVSGTANKRVKLDIKATGAIYLTQGARIENLRAKHSIIRLDRYGEGQFEIGFSLLGENKVSGQYKKQIKYEIEYLN
ncbi:hypothetical protein CXF72_05330 [Psychromonas sp. MB-3u-54]|uniref:hypothetical protein n=1 Tax=Psychromonas sp. MB-3u-54 TaxID=2058319 RepID=UPI000C335B38|nr:hypothetical protein [Psychromonas sp. MB-3u-54]PKH03632.1 hypothetical protein CXF72_05330 [Psychromonas sp. MB-3u-54]